MSATIDAQAITRRQWFGAAGVAAAALVVPPAAHAKARAVGPFAGLSPLRLAMHVHGSWSEGNGSWAAQQLQAALNDIDVLYMTDHDGRAVAYKYLTSMAGVTWARSSTGSLAQQDSTVTGGGFQVLAESASDAAPASVTLAFADKPSAVNGLRTGIAGQSLRHKLTSYTLGDGATYEVVVALSLHPATGGRPAGKYELRYRFGSGPSGRFTENGGLRGVVAAPPQAPGTTVMLVPEADIVAIWPDMLAMDNCFYGLSYVATSPRRGVVAQAKVASVDIIRTQSTPAHVMANQQHVIATYADRYPGVLMRATTEVSHHLPDMNPFGVPQFFSDYALDTAADHDAFYYDLVQQVHTGGGVISWNHPFGYNTGPLLSAAERVAKRRAVFAELRAVDLYGADILEVGYSLRGNVDIDTHLGLWDAFSRSGRFITGNGVGDDHSGRSWSTMGNGFVTGAWAASSADSDLVSALSGGRAYVAHCGTWPGGSIDMLVDGSAPMGSAQVSLAGSHTIEVSVSALPPGGRVDIVRGPVDGAVAGDPGTWKVTSFTESSFVGGVATVRVFTSTSAFVRATVRNAAGKVVGAGNPVWLLRSTPAGGIPPERQV